MKKRFFLFFTALMACGEQSSETQFTLSSLCEPKLMEDFNADFNAALDNLALEASLINNVADWPTKKLQARLEILRSLESCRATVESEYILNVQIEEINAIEANYEL